MLVHIDLFLFYVELKFGSRGATGESWNRPCLWVPWWFVVANKLLGQKRTAFIVVRADVKQTLLMAGAVFISELRLRKAVNRSATVHEKPRPIIASLPYEEGWKPELQFQLLFKRKSRTRALFFTCLRPFLEDILCQRLADR